MKKINDIFPLLDKPKNITITTHQKPDADAMGSSLGLYNFLIQFGHQVTVISPTNWASWVNWMPGSRKVVDYEMQKPKAEAVLDETEWLFCLDFNHYNRTKNLAPKLASLKCTKILIDHHEEPDRRWWLLGRALHRRYELDHRVRGRVRWLGPLDPDAGRHRQQPGAGVERLRG